jgi:serine/threonine protein kinase
MRDPVVCADGHTYDRPNIEQWFAGGQNTSPNTGARLPHLNLVPNHALRNSIEDFLRNSFREIARARFSLGLRIGSGASKIAHEGTLDGSRCVAVLQMKPGAASLDQEAAMMLKLSRHPNLVRFWGSCNEGGEQFIITELAQHGSVLKVIEELHDECRFLSMQHKIEIMRQVSSACEALALEGIVHRDISARNVLLFVFDPALPSSTVAKVSDFGMSVSAYGRSSLTVDGGAVPMRWMSPESLQRRRWSEKSDVWSFGVFCWELLSDGELPFALIASDAEVARMVLQGQQLEKPDACDAGLWTLIQSCWTIIPAHRPTFHELSSRLSSLVMIHDVAGVETIASHLFGTRITGVGALPAGPSAHFPERHSTLRAAIPMHERHYFPTGRHAQSEVEQESAIQACKAGILWEIFKQVPREHVPQIFEGSFGESLSQVSNLPQFHSELQRFGVLPMSPVESPSPTHSLTQVPCLFLTPSSPKIPNVFLMRVRGPCDVRVRLNPSLSSPQVGALRVGAAFMFSRVDGEWAKLSSLHYSCLQGVVDKCVLQNFLPHNPETQGFCILRVDGEELFDEQIPECGNSVKFGKCSFSCVCMGTGYQLYPNGCLQSA